MPRVPILGSQPEKSFKRSDVEWTFERLDHFNIRQQEKKFREMQDISSFFQKQASGHKIFHYLVKHQELQCFDTTKCTCL